VAYDEGMWVALRYELRYADGQVVEMKSHGRHPDVINVMEPSGSQRSAISLPINTFTLDSRSNTQLAKKAMMQRGELPLNSSRFVEIKPLDVMDDDDEMESCLVDVEVKFSTNVTSRQHDNLNFRWHSWIELDIGEGEMQWEACSESFQYVARQLKTPGKAKKAAQRKQAETDSDSEMDFEDIVPVPRDAVRRSKRKRAVPTYRRDEIVEAPAAAMGLEANEPEEPMHNQTAERAAYMEEEPAAKAAAPAIEMTPTKLQQQAMSAAEQNPKLGSHSPLSLYRDDSICQVARDFPVPQRQPQVAMWRQPSINSEEEEILRRETKGGRNLMRTDSIDRIFANEAINLSLTPSGMSMDGILDCSGLLNKKEGSDPMLTDKPEEKPDSKLALSRGGSWSDFFDTLVQVEPAQLVPHQG